MRIVRDAAETCALRYAFLTHMSYSDSSTSSAKDTARETPPTITSGAAARETLASHQEPTSRMIAANDNITTPIFRFSLNFVNEKMNTRRKITGRVARTWV